MGADRRTTTPRRALGNWGRRGVLALTVAVVLLGVVGAVVGVTTVTENSMIGGAKRSSMKDSALLAQVGFAAASSDGRLSDADLRAAEAQIDAARRTDAISRVLVWDTSGRVVFSDFPRGGGKDLPSRAPQLVREAMQTRRTLVMSSMEAGGGRVIDTVVPVGTPHRQLVAEIQFHDVALATEIAQFRERVYLAGGLLALLLCLALPRLMVAVGQRLPTKEDRRREAEVARLASALDRGELQLYFQPKFSIEKLQVIGVEALVRWQHPDRGTVGPGEFVPLLETSHLLDRFTMAVLSTAVETAGRWHAEGLDLPVAVNISAEALAGDQLVAQVEEALDRTGIPARLLTLEITETGLSIAGEEAAWTLIRLRRLGVSISIDDFGTGYSSLFRLGALPLDELKVDRSFVTAMASSVHVRGVLRLIADLGRQMDLQITAEGVETDEELELLASIGYDAVQGFLFAPPMPEKELLEWLAASRGDGTAEACGLLGP